MPGVREASPMADGDAGIWASPTSAGFCGHGASRQTLERRRGPPRSSCDGKMISELLRPHAADRIRSRASARATPLPPAVKQRRPVMWPCVSVDQLLKWSMSIIATPERGAVVRCEGPQFAEPLRGHGGG